MAASKRCSIFHKQCRPKSDIAVRRLIMVYTVRSNLSVRILIINTVGHSGPAFCDKCNKDICHDTVHAYSIVYHFGLHLNNICVPLHVLGRY